MKRNQKKEAPFFKILNNKKFYLLVAFFSIFSYNQLSATTLLYQPFKKIVKRANLVIIGKVINIETTEEDIDGFGDNIPTQYITIQVDQILRNKYDNDFYEITIRQIGGTINGNSLYIDGLPSFTIGQKVLLNLNLNPNNGYFYVVGAALGKYELDGRGNAIAETTDSMFVRKGEGGFIQIASTQPKEKSLQDLINQVHQVNEEEEQE